MDTMVPIDIVVAPNGVMLPEGLPEQVENPQLLWTLAGVAGAFVRATAAEVAEPIKVRVDVARSDEVAIFWVVGSWVLYASDLRAGTLSMFCEMVRKSRAKSAMRALLGVPSGPVTIPHYAMSLLARNEGIPVGIIVQTVEDPVPLPMFDIRLSDDVQTMWLASVHCNLVARLGEPALRAALATVAELRAAHPDPGAFVDHLPGALMEQHIVDDEAVACIVLEEWHRKGGAAELAALRAMIAP
jgi:hypothetical protein